MVTGLWISQALVLTPCDHVRDGSGERTGMLKGEGRGGDYRGDSLGEHWWAGEGKTAERGLTALRCMRCVGVESVWVLLQ